MSKDEKFISLHPTPSALHPPQKPRLLVVEDDEAIRTQMKWALAQDYEVFLAEDRLSALGNFKQRTTSCCDSGPWSAAVIPEK